MVLIEEEKNCEVYSRPRFKLDFEQSPQELTAKFKSKLEEKDCNYSGKIVGTHIVIDVSKQEVHFWLPQLHIEVEKAAENKTHVKGMFGPKPQVWTLFMFFHFTLAIAFIGFSIMA